MILLFIGRDFSGNLLVSERLNSLDMTASFVFAALIIASVAYSVFDGRRAEAARRMDDFYRVEFKKSYVVKDEIAAQNWY